MVVVIGLGLVSPEIVSWVYMLDVEVRVSGVRIYGGGNGSACLQEMYD